MPGYMAFAPITALLLGAILILLLPRARAIGPREQGVLAFLTASTSFILSLALWEEKPLSFTISHWRPLAQFGGELAYHIDDLALTFVLLATFASVAAMLTSLDFLIHEGSAYFYMAILTLLAAGLSSFLSANLLTLYVSWGFLDLSILFLIGFHGGKEKTAQDLTKTLAASHLSGLALMTAALRLGQSMGQSVTFPLLLAALLRLGLYPLHLWLPINMERPSPAVALLRIIPTSAGMCLLMRLSALSPQSLPQRDALLLVGSLALVASALLLWQGEKSRGWPSYLLVNQVAYAVLAMALDASPRGIMAALLQTVNLVLAWSILFLRRRSGNETSPRLLLDYCILPRTKPLSVCYRSICSPHLRIRSYFSERGFVRHKLSHIFRGEVSLSWVGERVILSMAVASLLGLPLTPGFPARWLLYGLAFEGGHRLLIVAGVAANLITAAPLLDTLFGDALPRLKGITLEKGRDDETSRLKRYSIRAGREVSSESASSQEEGKRDNKTSPRLLSEYRILPRTKPLSVCYRSIRSPHLRILSYFSERGFVRYIFSHIFRGEVSSEVGLLGLGLLAAPLLLFGLIPSALPIKVLGGGVWLPSVDEDVAAWSLALLLLPPLGGYLLHRRGRVLDHIGLILRKLCAVISLEWLYRSLWWLSLKAGNVLQGAMGAIEGERCLGWLLLSAFVIALLLLGE